jgi:hypothetical protein
VARYGVEGDWLQEGGSNGSIWSQQIVRIREGIGVQVEGWFEENLSRKVEIWSG